MYIKNCRNSCNIKVCSPIKLYRKLKILRFEVGNFSYTNRWSSQQVLRFWKSVIRYFYWGFPVRPVFLFPLPFFSILQETRAFYDNPNNSG